MQNDNQGSKHGPAGFGSEAGRGQGRSSVSGCWKQKCHMQIGDQDWELGSVCKSATQCFLML